MAQIQLYQRQQSVPRTAGSEIQVAGIQDETGKALMGLGDQFGKIGGKLQLAQDNRDLSTSVLNGTLKMQDLTTEMSKLDGQTAITTYQERANAIHTEIATGMNTRTLDAFNQKWNTLYATAEAKIKSAGITRWRQQLEGGMEKDLDAIGRAAGAPTATAFDHTLMLREGDKMIDDMVSKRVIAPDVGARRKIKLRGTVAKNGVEGWLNRQTENTLMDAFRQMDTGKFDDKSVGAMWAQLDEAKKGALTSRAITNLSRIQTFKKKQAAAETALRSDAAKTLMIEFYKSGTTSARRAVIMRELAVNKEVQIGTFNTMMKDMEGRTTRFNDPKKSAELRVRIFRTPELVTDDEILNSGLSNVNELLTLRKAERTGQMRRAEDIIKAAPAFVPSNMADRRIKGDAFNVAQAEIWSQVLAERDAAIRDGSAFDPVARAQELIKAYETQQQAGPSTGARATLQGLGITKIEDVDVYIQREIPNGLTQQQISNIRKMAREAFPDE